MIIRVGPITGFFVGLTTLFAGCEKSSLDAPSHVEPAHVERHVSEGDLNRITLTEQAEKRLGIQLAEVQQREMNRRRQLGGEVVLPPGKSIIVSAPVAGTVMAPEGSVPPLPGSQVTAGQTVFCFKPLLTPERDVLTPSERVRVAQSKADVATAQIEAQRQIESAKVAVEAARIRYDRAVQLLRDRAGSQRSVDEAEATLRLAQENVTTAEARYKLLSGIQLDEAAGELAIQNIVSPEAGMLQDFSSAVGETVAAGDALFSVIATRPVWIRVPIYVGRRTAVDTTRSATVTEFGQPPDGPRQEATYVMAPPTANAIAATVDVYYQLANADGSLQPGQVLSVAVPLNDRTSKLVVPSKAILYDVHGGTWVYQFEAEHVFARQRVSVEYVEGDSAVLANGPDPGCLVVTDGAAELFGTEFGVGH